MTSRDAEQVRKLVRAWPDVPMTWELVVAKVGRELGSPLDNGTKGAGGWSRQALSGHPDIKKAFAERKTELTAEKRRTEAKPSRNRDPEVVMLRREAEALRIENKDLREKLARYEERFATILHNRALGKAPDQLETPLKPKMDRLGRT